MPKYDHATIEKKWQERWRQSDAHRAMDADQRTKFYALVEFPYPSGDGLHVGHLRSYTAMDVIARKRRMEGWNVLYPMGWDAFGLPAENYAVKTGQHPAITTAQNIANFRRQLTAMGFSFDWSREVNTTDPAYYKWTQWIFLKLLEHGLAYKARVPINWCPSCKIGLANEEAVGGVCERCGCPVEQREKEQWMLRITAYAEKLLAGLDTVDYIERAKTQQRNWIGKSAGALLQFQISNFKSQISVFTTRPDTLFGATYVVLAPEHPIIENLSAKGGSAFGGKSQISNWSEVEAYIAQARTKKEIERAAEDREKTGVELKGIRAVNPANNEEIPVWIADYVLGSYGTGAIMAVPAHDERDWAFAKKYGLPIISVIARESANEAIPAEEKEMHTGDGTLMNSGAFDGMRSEDAKRAITEKVGGTMTVTYKLRDWVFSRQRYWGEPIPVVFCAGCAKDNGIAKKKSDIFSVHVYTEYVTFSTCQISNIGGIPHAIVPVPEDQLPVTLPEVEKYQPTETGESPLANIAEWVNTKCPRCGGSAKRETDVMPNWAGSSWYFLAYAVRGISNFKFQISNNQTAFRYWLPVDWYNGGMEHTTLHLLYSRFWNLFLHDIGVVPVAEPYAKRTSHGMILAKDGEKMSKSRGNVVNPDAIVAQYGADAVRVYEMFIGPFDQAVPWSTNGLVGCRRFLEKVAGLIDRVAPRNAVSFRGVSDEESHTPRKSEGGEISHHDQSVGIRNDTHVSPHTESCQSHDPLLHRTIKKVTEDIEGMRFNTAVSAMMECVNELGKREHIAFFDYVTLLVLLAPFAPHVCEELHARLERRGDPAPAQSAVEGWSPAGVRGGSAGVPASANAGGDAAPPLQQAHSIFAHPWPVYDPARIVEDEVDMVVQVNGKVRATMRVATDITEADATARALAEPNVAKHLGGKQPTKVIFVAGRLVSIVV